MQLINGKQKLDYLRHWWTEKRLKSVRPDLDILRTTGSKLHCVGKHHLVLSARIWPSAAVQYKFPQFTSSNYRTSRQPLTSTIRIPSISGILHTEQVGLAVQLYVRTQGEHTSNIGRDIASYDWGFLWFSSVFPGKFGDIASIRSWPLSFESSPIYHSSTIQPFDCT
jgi:hypothetical protein